MPSGMGTLHQHATIYITGRRARGEISASTAADLRWTLNAFSISFGDRPLAQLGPAAVDRWLESIGDHAPATRREYLSRVKGFLRWMVAEGHLRTDPTVHVQPIRQSRRAVRTLSVDQVESLLETLPNRRARAVILLMVGCGLRCVEVSRLHVEDYDGATVFVRGKRGNERIVPVPTVVRRAVSAYMEETGVVAGPLIRNELRPHHGLSPKTLSGYVRQWMSEAGVKAKALDGRSAHALRRTAASDVMDHSGDIRLVQAMLGHVRLETTAAHYLRPVSMADLADAMEGRYAS